MAFGRNDGALVLNLINMKTLSYDEIAETLTYGGPVTISEAARFLWHNHSRALMHGRCPDVGMSGVGFGGGFGTLSRLHGTVLDEINSVRVALANGTIVNASRTENTDVLWAVRGAAASVGSVLTTTIETVSPPSENVVSYTIGFNSSVDEISIEDNIAALLGVQTWARSAENVDNLSLRFGVNKNSSMAGFYYGTNTEFGSVAASLLQHLPKMSILKQDNVDFWASENLTTPGIAEGSITPRRYSYTTSMTVPNLHPLSNGTARSLFESTAYAPEPAEGRASGFVDLWGGEFAKDVAADESAWKHDNNLFLVRWDLRGEAVDQPFTRETMLGLRRRFYDFVNAYEADGGVAGGFPNYRDAEWSVNDTAKYLHGSNWGRLLAVKKRLDPEGLFNADPQDVPI